MAGPWQGAFRVGQFDAVVHRYAVEVAGGVDSLALTHLDVAQRHSELGICSGYRAGGGTMTRIAPGVRGDLAAAALGASVLIESYGPSSGEKTGSLHAGDTGVNRGEMRAPFLAGAQG